jgi:D-alanine-D-alanine ligase
MAEKIRLAVMLGGKSNEHSISVATAGSVLSAIDRSKYEVIPIGITKKGDFVPFEVDPKSLSLAEGLKEVRFEGERLEFALDSSRELYKITETGSRESLGVIDVVMPLLHGPFGEDGVMQGYLELVGVPYVGNGVLASAAAMDKQISKALFRANGIATPEHAVISQRDMVNDPESALEKIRSLKKLPVFVKPARAGSSVGITRVTNWDQLTDALATAFAHDDKVIVEVGVVGRELECGVLDGRGDEPLRVSVAGEIVVTGRDFYDFEAKYLKPEAATLSCPADLTEQQLLQLQQLAKKAFLALGCRGLARVDFFLTEQGPMVSEINTMPGFTSISMFPRCWEQSGMSYPELIDELISLALGR